MIDNYYEFMLYYKGYHLIYYSLRLIMNNINLTSEEVNKEITNKISSYTSKNDLDLSTPTTNTYKCMEKFLKTISIYFKNVKSNIDS